MMGFRWPLLAAFVLVGLTDFLSTMGTTNAVLLGILLGGMMCVDLGGPINWIFVLLSSSAWSWCDTADAEAPSQPMAATSPSSACVRFHER